MGDLLRGLFKGAVEPKANDSRFLLDVHTRDLPGEKTMRRYADDDEVDAGSLIGRAIADAHPAFMAVKEQRPVEVDRWDRAFNGSNDNAEGSWRVA